MFTFFPNKNLKRNYLVTIQIKGTTINSVAVNKILWLISALSFSPCISHICEGPSLECSWHVCVAAERLKQRVLRDVRSGIREMSWCFLIQDLDGRGKNLYFIFYFALHVMQNLRTMLFRGGEWPVLLLTNVIMDGVWKIDIKGPRVEEGNQLDAISVSRGNDGGLK